MHFSTMLLRPPCTISVTFSMAFAIVATSMYKYPSFSTGGWNAKGSLKDVDRIRWLNMPGVSADAGLTGNLTFSRLIDVGLLDPGPCRSTRASERCVPTSRTSFSACSQ